MSSHVDPGLTELTADCGSCVALCCVALPFSTSADFAVDKAAGTPCGHLDGFRCGIHDRLSEHGFPGCVAFDCFGAGQKVTRATAGGPDWRSEPGRAEAMFEAFDVVRRLHELLWHLRQSLALPAGAGLQEDLRADLRAAAEDVLAAADGDVVALAAVDLAAAHAAVDRLLTRVSRSVRARSPGPRRALRGADLVGARLAGEDLRGADLRGALLVAADLRQADLREADLIGADLRAADLRGADLSTSLFLDRSRIAAARGDGATRLPAHLAHPPHWPR